MVPDTLNRSPKSGVVLASCFAVLVLMLPSSAAAVPVVGEPLPARPAGSVNPVEGTYVVEDLRVADPAGGLPWSFATFIARPQNAPGEAVCVEIGRTLEGRLGMVEDGGAVFRPFVPTLAPVVQCGLRQGGKDSRGFGFSSVVLPAHVVGCDAGADPSAVCGRGPRTAMVGSFGDGILGAWMRDRDEAAQLAVSKSGAFLAIFPGRFTDASFPTVSVQATVCGPDARRDLLQTWRATRNGCLLTFDVPTGPRPQSESAASKRARRLPALHRQVRIVENRRAAPRRRFSARATVPITVRSSAEGYAYRLTGPTGAGCKRSGVVDTSRSYTSNYLIVEGGPLRLRLTAPRRDGRWCRGTYRVTLLHVHISAQQRQLVFRTRPIGRTNFTVR